MNEIAVPILPEETKERCATRASGLAYWQHWALFLGSSLIVISHRPDAILNAQFWAEDGTKWYADAHNFGTWNVLFHPYAGYLHTLPRLIAGVAQMLPLAAAPLLFNLVAIFFQVLPVNFFLSSRFAFLASTRTRLLLSFLYLALPNTSEIDANITNTQWHLALLLCLVFMATPAASILWRCFDLAAVALSSLTGPFAIFLLPLAGVAWGWKRRERWPLILLATLTTGALVQLITLARTGSAGRVQGSLLAGPVLFAKILASQMFVGSVLGRNIMYSRPSCAELITIAGIAILLYALWKAAWEVKFFIAFACLILAVSLADPMVPAPKWPSLMVAWGFRYWFIPILAFAVALVWMAGEGRPRSLRFTAVVLLLLMTTGIARDWRYRPFANLAFGAYARQYSSLPNGSKLLIPLNPRGWSMTLAKR